MERNMRTLPPQELLEPLLELLEQTEAVPLVISGNSMAPFLIHRRDTVYLSKVTKPLKKGDMILYRRDNGDYILHRICKVCGDTYCLVGDAQVRIEPGIRADQVLAIVSAVRRKGKLLRKGSFWWSFFETVWLWVIPLRRHLIGLYGLLKGQRNKENADD